MLLCLGQAVMAALHSHCLCVSVMLPVSPVLAGMAGEVRGREGKGREGKEG